MTYVGEILGPCARLSGCEPANLLGHQPLLVAFLRSLLVGCLILPILLYWTPLPLAQAFICGVLLLVLTPILMTLTDTYDTGKLVERFQRFLFECIILFG